MKEQVSHEELKIGDIIEIRTGDDPQQPGYACQVVRLIKEHPDEVIQHGELDIRVLPQMARKSTFYRLYREKETRYGAVQEL